MAVGTVDEAVHDCGSIVAGATSTEAVLCRMESMVCGGYEAVEHEFLQEFEQDGFESDNSKVGRDRCGAFFVNGKGSAIAPGVGDEGDRNRPATEKTKAGQPCLASSPDSITCDEIRAGGFVTGK